MGVPMGKEKKAFALRLDPTIHRALEQWAADEFRSVNGHIEFLLRDALSKAGRLKQPSKQSLEEKE